jgi:hypothetical protein
MTNYSNFSNQRRYTLASNKAPKLNCPYCGAKKHWQQYLDIETGIVLPREHGCCDNSQKCGKWITPKDTGYAKMIWEREQGVTGVTKVTVPKQNYFRTKPKRSTVFFDFETFKKTLEPSRYSKNVFIQNLLNSVPFPFNVEEVTKVIQLYRLGTVVSNCYMYGSITFPFCDLKNNVRAVQVKQFDDNNKTINTSFLHSIIEGYHSKRNKPLPQWLEAYKKNDLKVSCLFGSHLLSKYPHNPIALTEAPKSAIYGALYFGFPEQPTNFIWMAVYNLSSLNLEKCKDLKGRNVYLFPDLSKDGKAFELWSKKAAEIQKQLSGTYFHVSDLLEQLAPTHDKEEGKDIADYLIQHDWRQFRNQESEKSEGQKETLFSQYINSLTLKDGVWLSPQGYPMTWDLFGNDANEETKEFIRKAETNPQLIHDIQCRNY